MKRLLLLICVPLFGMNKTTIDVFIDQKLDLEVQSSTTHTSVRREDYLKILRKNNADLADESKYEIRFMANIRGSGFEVFAREIEESIIATYKKGDHGKK